jgi:hypothetical protein
MQPSQQHTCLKFWQIVALRMAKTEEKSKVNPEEVTKKWGLEAGLFTALKNKEGGKKHVKRS